MGEQRASFCSRWRCQFCQQEPGSVGGMYGFGISCQRHQAICRAAHRTPDLNSNPDSLSSSGRTQISLTMPDKLDEECKIFLRKILEEANIDYAKYLFKKKRFQLHEAEGISNLGMYECSSACKKTMIVKVVPLDDHVPAKRDARHREFQALQEIRQKYPAIISDEMVTFPILIAESDDFIDTHGSKRKVYATLMQVAPGEQLQISLESARTFEYVEIVKSFGSFLAQFHGKYPDLIHTDCKPKNIYYHKETAKFTLIDADSLITAEQFYKYYFGQDDLTCREISSFQAELFQIAFQRTQREVDEARRAFRDAYLNGLHGNPDAKVTAKQLFQKHEEEVDSQLRHLFPRGERLQHTCLIQ